MPKPKSNAPLIDDAMSKRRRAPSPEDAYFRAVFSYVEVAVQLIRFQMPPELLEQLDLDTLELAPDSFVDAKLRKSLSDHRYQTGHAQPAAIHRCRNCQSFQRVSRASTGLAGSAQKGSRSISVTKLYK